MVIHLIGEYIKLGQALKAANLVESGAEAKEVILNGEVFVNGETETRRGRKLVPGDIAEYNGETVEIVL
ncbi:MAG: RNA-binding S4 domain-containing protein [Lachnospiraceae bacterium]|nr:RNA-binding S4 domain-containing protein [Lachnospiraceae bacterium]